MSALGHISSQSILYKGFNCGPLYLVHWSCLSVRCPPWSRYKSKWWRVCQLRRIIVKKEKKWILCYVAKDLLTNTLGLLVLADSISFLQSDMGCWIGLRRRRRRRRRKRRRGRRRRRRRSLHCFRGNLMQCPRKSWVHHLSVTRISRHTAVTWVNMHRYGTKYPGNTQKRNAGNLILNT